MRLRKVYLPLFFVLSILSCENDEDKKKVNCEESSLSIEVNRITSSSNCSNADGSIEITVHGGEEPYIFFLNNEVKSGPLFEDLTSGIFTVGVKDKNGCEKAIENIPVMAEGFSFSAIVQENTTCVGTGNGSVSIMVEEGIPPYEYKFGNQDFAESNTFQSLTHGNYNMLLKDGNGCTVSLSVTIPKGVTGTSWQNDVQPLIKTYCALTGCHNGLSRPDLRVYEKAKQYASQIKAFTQDRSMPFDGSLTQNQIDIISCWVDEGALNN